MGTAQRYSDSEFESAMVASQSPSDFIGPQASRYAVTSLTDRRQDEIPPRSGRLTNPCLLDTRPSTK